MEVLVKKLLLAAVAGLLMAACSESTAPTTPKAAATSNARADFECRSGYIVAYDENGNPYCVPVDGGDAMTARPRS